MNAPLSYPKSSLSRSVSGRAPRFTDTNGWPHRSLRLWMARAASSLPVPLSPLISTVASLRATCRIWRSRSWVARQLPMISGSSPVSASRSRNARFSNVSRRCSSALRTCMRITFRSTGFVTKSNAPCRIASTAISTDPNAVITMTLVSGRVSRICLSNPSPSSSPGKRTSVITTSCPPSRNF